MALIQCVPRALLKPPYLLFPLQLLSSGDFMQWHQATVLHQCLSQTAVMLSLKKKWIPRNAFAPCSPCQMCVPRSPQVMLGENTSIAAPLPAVQAVFHVYWAIILFPSILCVAFDLLFCQSQG